MSLQRFEAESTSAALGAVRAALGTDAIILSNRRVGERVEIIATGVLEDAMFEFARVAEAAARESGDEPDGQGDADADAEGQGDGYAGVQAEAVAARFDASEAEGDAGRPVAVPAEVPGKGAIGTRTEARVETSQESAPPVSEQGPIDTPAPVAVKVPIESAVPTASIAPAGTEPDRLAEVSADAVPDPALAGIDARLQRLEVGLWGNEDPERARLLRRMLSLGLGTSLALQLVERARGENAGGMVRDALAMLKSSLPIACDTTLREPGTTILCGPDSESRIDMLMKLGKGQVVAGGTRSLVLVCADDARLGAFETLEACGRSLGVAVVRARGAGELLQTRDAFSDRALVLVDGGREIPRVAEDAAGEGGDGKSAATTLRRLLVLPATLQRTAVHAAVAQAHGAGADGCILARLDAAARLGECLDALIAHWLPICWWSDRDDIDASLEPANGSVIVATAVAMARRLGECPDDRVLANLLHPARERRARAGFEGAVKLDGTAPPKELD